MSLMSSRLLAPFGLRSIVGIRNRIRRKGPILFAHRRSKPLVGEASRTNFTGKRLSLMHPDV
jgi:hypothetical protein